MNNPAPEFNHSQGPVVSYDALPLRPHLRHWGVGVFVQNVIARLSGEFQFLGLGSAFQPPEGYRMCPWPAIPKTQKFFFEVSPLFSGPFDLYWGANHLIPQAVRPPSVVTVHDLLFVNDMDNAKWAKLMRWRFYSSLRRSRKIATNSGTTADQLISQFPEFHRKVEVALHGFDVPPDAGPEEPLDNKAAAESPYVMMLGAHCPRKNLGLALQVAACLNDGSIRVPLLLAGNVHTCFSSLLQSKTAWVRQTGVLSRQKLYALLRGATALLFTSIYEGFGLPTLEAMAAGCPVLALDTPINREIGGEAAWLLPEDPRIWAKAVETLLSSSQARDETREKGLKNVMRFSWDHTASVYRQIFNELGR